MSNQSLEDALEDVERAADGAVRAAAAVLAEAKRVKAAAATGQLRALRQSLESMSRLADQATESAREMKARWTFDEQEYFASGAYTSEVLEVAAEEGLSAFESDDRILSYPAIVSLSASDTAVLIDKRKDRQGSSLGARADIEGASGQAPQVQARGLPRGTGRRVRPGRWHFGG